MDIKTIPFFINFHILKLVIIENKIKKLSIPFRRKPELICPVLKKNKNCSQKC